MSPNINDRSVESGVNWKLGNFLLGVREPDLTKSPARKEVHRETLWAVKPCSSRDNAIRLALQAGCQQEEEIYQTESERFPKLQSSQRDWLSRGSHLPALSKTHQVRQGLLESWTKTRNNQSLKTGNADLVITNNSIYSSEKARQISLELCKKTRLAHPDAILSQINVDGVHSVALSRFLDEQSNIYSPSSFGTDDMEIPSRNQQSADFSSSSQFELCEDPTNRRTHMSSFLSINAPSLSPRLVGSALEDPELKADRSASCDVSIREESVRKTTNCRFSATARPSGVNFKNGSHLPFRPNELVEDNQFEKVKSGLQQQPSPRGRVSVPAPEFIHQMQEQNNSDPASASTTRQDEFIQEAVRRKRQAKEGSLIKISASEVTETEHQIDLSGSVTSNLSQDDLIQEALIRKRLQPKKVNFFSSVVSPEFRKQLRHINNNLSKAPISGESPLRRKIVEQQVQVEIRQALLLSKKQKSERGIACVKKV